MIALDTSVIVAGLLSWHERHAAAARALERALGSSAGVLIPAQALIESYAVMTRLPAPHRLAPADALHLLRENFGDVRVAAHGARSVFPLLTQLAGASLGGGIVYDAVILDTAADAGADSLLTLDARDYERLPERIRITGV